MPVRKLAFKNHYYYHIYNRGLERRPTFTTRKELLRAQQTLWFYQYQNLPVRLSRYNQLNPTQKQLFFTHKKPQVKIIAYAFLTNHFHILLKQTQNGGVSRYIANFQNSYTKYYNFIHSRSGNLFQNPFKAKLIETDEQLLHLSRYIHLNPYKHALVKKLYQLPKYQWSSYPEYLERPVKLAFIDKKIVLSQLKTSENYQKFVTNQAEYQKLLDKISHLALE